MKSAKELKKEIKEIFGVKHRDLSVIADNYSMGSAIRITIKSLNYDIDSIKEFCRKHENIDRCEASGEILSGGNHFVFAQYEPREISERLIALVSKVIEHFNLEGVDRFILPLIAKRAAKQYPEFSESAYNYVLVSKTSLFPKLARL